MIICGIDMSKNSPAVVKFLLDDKLDIISKRFITFTTTKKYEEDNIIYYKKEDFDCDLAQYVFIKNHIKNFMIDLKCDGDVNPDYVGLEGYAYSGTGMVFDIAEITCTIKMMVYDREIPLRIYDPPSIKMYATGLGNADKIHMEEDYEKLPIDERFDLRHLPLVSDKKKGNPKDNIVDAFYIAKLLQLELKLRNGIITLRDLDPKTIRIFNRVTKSNPVNILDTDFIIKKTNILR